MRWLPSAQRRQHVACVVTHCIPAIAGQKSGDETGDTRRPALRSELEDSAWALAQKLAELRLIVASHSEGEESIELVHEALIRHWSLLRESIDVFFCSCLPRSFPLGK